MIRTNYIFVDFENVQETDFDRVANRPVKVMMVLGEQHKRLPVKLVQNILKHGGQIELIETGRTGKNALDLVLAQHIGLVRAADPNGYFHIVSKDKGFDALVGHLNDNGTLARRHTSFSEIPVLMNASERASLISRQLKSHRDTRPKKVRGLKSQIQVAFGKTLSEPEVEDTLQSLVREKIVTLSSTGVVAYGDIC
jgi:hypothetical protein